MAWARKRVAAPSTWSLRQPAHRLLSLGVALSAAPARVEPAPVSAPVVACARVLAAWHAPPRRHPRR
ncbi:MAG: hypothetical protein MZW92_31970 [Comamonadaceae bacterium]|nr:hypothetical protein [Comamonadaceae bacterium]